MKTFDSVTLAMGAAGTGGFAVLNSGCAVYTPLQQWILTIAMIAFGVNFNFYYLMLCKRKGRHFVPGGKSVFPDYPSGRRRDFLEYLSDVPFHR